MNELLRPTNIRSGIIIINTVAFLFHLFVKVLVIFSASSMTKEAEKLAILVSKTLNECKFSDGLLKIDFICFITQARSRNLNLHNHFFNINWNVLVTVSFKGCAQEN